MADNYLLGPLMKKLDAYYYDVESCYNPILNPRALFKVNQYGTENSLKQQYHLKEGSLLLRFDHTHVMFHKSPYLRPHTNVKNVGPVFRDSPTTSYRWKEFYQYDVDYQYGTHGIRPLLKWFQFLKDHSLTPYARTQVNDLELLKSMLHTQQINESNIKAILQSVQFNYDSYSTLFFEKHPGLKNVNLTVNPELVRGWSYYEDLVFETKHHKSKWAFAAGGTYKIDGKTYIGVSVGLNRLLKLARDENLLVQLLPPKKCILVYNKTNVVPDLLLDALQANQLDYCLRTKKNNFITDYNRVATALKETNRVICKTIIWGPNQLATGNYNYRSQTKDYGTLSLTELINVLKEQLDRE